MSLAQDDLSGLFADSPAGPGRQMTYRQGIIREWNPITLENTVVVGGKELVNLPVLGVAEAASYGAGVVVGIVSIGENWAIVGQFVTPGTPAATDAITQLGQQLVSDLVVTEESTTTFGSFVDLTTIGPRVSLVASASGKAYVTVSCYQSPSSTSFMGTVGMDFEIASDGGTFRTPDVKTALLFGVSVFGTAGPSAVSGGSRTTRITGLTPGVVYTYTAKYITGQAAGGVFGQRMITVLNA